jgi:hypothetical protein
LYADPALGQIFIFIFTGSTENYAAPQKAQFV